MGLGEPPRRSPDTVSHKAAKVLENPIWNTKCIVEDNKMVCEYKRSHEKEHLSKKISVPLSDSAGPSSPALGCLRCSKAGVLACCFLPP